MHKNNWDDLRFVLAVAETGSVSAAARDLGVNHATVLRRIAAFEDRQGAPIFDRTPQGYQVHPSRLRVIEAAREVALAIDAMDRMIKGAQAELSGVVRVTSTDTFCVAILPEVLRDIKIASPGLRIELGCSNAHVDLARLHADIAVRPALRLPDDLRGEAAGQMVFAAYAPKSGGAEWLGLRGTLARSVAASWMQTHVSQSDAAGADSFLVLRDMAAAGLGRAILPCCLGDGDSRLVRLSGLPPIPPVPIWVAGHSDLSDVPRLRIVRRLLAAGLMARADRLTGSGSTDQRA